MKRVALISLFLLFVAYAYSDNTIETSNEGAEDPNYILDKARANVADKKYAEALKDYIWFFENSTKINT